MHLLAQVLRLLLGGQRDFKAAFDSDCHGGRHTKLHVHRVLLHSYHGLSFHHFVPRHEPSHVWRTSSHCKDLIRCCHWSVYLLWDGRTRAFILNPPYWPRFLLQYSPHELPHRYLEYYLRQHETNWYFQVQSQPLLILREVHDSF